jgi:hypothetical protein
MKLLRVFEEHALATADSGHEKTAGMQAVVLGSLQLAFIGV